MEHQLSAGALPGIEEIPGTGTYEWEVARNRVTWSGGLLRLYGLDTAPTDDVAFLQFVHPDDRLRVEAETSSFLETGTSYSHSFRILRPDGTVRLVLDRGAIKRDAQGAAIRLRGLNVDITEEAADADEQRPPRLASGFGRYDFDVTNGRAQWSAELRRILGDTGGDESGSFEMALTRVHHLDRDEVRKRMQEVMSRVGEYDLEYRIMTRGGETLWVRDRGETFGPVDPQTGLARRAIGFINDITDRKAAEASLRAASGLLESLFDNAPVGLGVWDRDFRYVRVNAKLAEINGLPEEAHIGKRPDEILGEIEGLDDLYRRWGEILETGAPWMNVEITGKTPGSGGERRVWEAHFFPVREGQEIVGVAVLVEDVTERKAAQIALENNAKQLQRILDGNVGFVGILEPDGTLVEANATALEAGGLSRADVIGRKFWDVYWWNYDAESQERLRHAVETAAAGQSVRYDAVVRMKGDVRITIDFLLSPVRDDEGRITHLIPSGFDITDRKQALEHVKLLMDEVNHRSKNVLSLVQAIARQTVRSSGEDFLTKFSDRITALARAQDLLVKANWDKVDLEHLVRNQLSHFGDALDRRILLEGPSLAISAQAAQSLSMVLHELATNAAKYGALSNGAGKVAITWEARRGEEAEPLLSLRWRENGGPPVKETSHRGFGSTLMESMVQAAFGVRAQVEYTPEGLDWRLENG